MANSPDAEGQTLPEMMLEDMRWKADQAIINHEGESVWLKQETLAEPIVLRGYHCPLRGRWIEPITMTGYLTDCCFTADPCERHAL